MAAAKNLVGPHGQLYAEPQPGADETAFQVSNTSAQYYNSAYYEAHKNQVQAVPAPRSGAALQLDLQDFIGPALIAQIQQAGRITFHSVGDTGAAKVSRSQTEATAIAHEAGVADAMAAEVAAGGPDAPAFFFHLGDVVYNFGEAQYYYDQFYEPFRGYDRPIFAIPGNHDGMVFGPGTSAPQVPTLQAFLTNFCAAAPGRSPEAPTMLRSVMTQPGVYFTVDAPFVSVIGLYSNVLEGPGVISSQKGNFPAVGDGQLAFLNSEMKRLAADPDRKAGKRAVVIALHHPPSSVDARHSGSTGALADMDQACKAAGLWPDLVLSGHAHLYQRFTRRPKGVNKEIPYLVAGSGGFAATAPQSTLGNAPVTQGEFTMEINPIVEFGYLTIATDGATLTASFRSPSGTGVNIVDSVSVNLRTGIVTSGSSAAGNLGLTLSPGAHARSRKKARRAPAKRRPSR